ncbi:MAG: hypothetical protein RRY20_08490, partial [Bilophila sp.]
MTRTRTLIIIGVFMLCLAVLAALEFRTEDSVLSEGQMVTGSVSKDVSVMPSDAQVAPPQQMPAVPEAETKGGVLVPLDNGTLRGTSGTTLDMTNTAQTDAAGSPSPQGATPLAVAPTATPPAVPAVTAQHQKEEKATHTPEVKPAATKDPAKTAPPAKTTPSKKTTPAKVETPPAKTTNAPAVQTTKAPVKLVGNQKAITKARLKVDKGVSFRITGAAALTAKTLLLENPDRYVVDLQGEWGISLPKVPKNV